MPIAILPGAVFLAAAARLGNGWVAGPGLVLAVGRVPAARIIAPSASLDDLAYELDTEFNPANTAAHMADATGPCPTPGAQARTDRAD